MHREIDDPIARMNALMRLHRWPLLRYLTRLTAHEHSAEDFVQETMLRAWRHLESMPADEAGQRRWLFVVARRLVIDAVRRDDVRPVEVSLSLAERDPHTDDTASIALAGQSLLAAFGDLSTRHREVLSEIYFHGRSVDETADRLRVPLGTIKSRTHYALAILRESLISC